METEFDLEYGYIKRDGKYYELDDEKGLTGKLKIKEAKDAKEKIKKAKVMTKHLEESLDREAVLMASIMKLENTDFEILYKMVKSGRKYKPKTRQDRCVDMKVGNFVLPIVD